MRVLALLLLAGCATVEPPKLLTEIQIMRIEVPVPVPCVVNIPPRPATALPLPDADIARKAAGASADVRALNQHADQLEAALRACAQGGATP